MKPKNHAKKYTGSVLEVLEVNGEEGDYEPRRFDKPTDFPPGTRAKVEVLARRVEQGQTLWTPGDLQDFSNVDGKAWGLGDSASSLMSSYETREIKRLRGARGRRETD